MRKSKTHLPSLDIDFCGIGLEHPFLLAAGPPTATRELIWHGLEAGWAGAVTKTICQNKDLPTQVANRFAVLCNPAANGACKNYYALENIELISDRRAEDWFKDLKAISKKYPHKLLIASIMAAGNDRDGWKRLARRCQESGAKILELNLSCPHGMSERGMGSAVGQDAELSAQVTRWVAEEVSIPVMPKLTPNVTDIACVAKAVVEGGARAVSAINTVGAVMGIDLETLSPIPQVKGSSTAGGMSGPAVKPIALKAVSSIAKCVQVPISGIGGIQNGWDAAEFMLLGARTMQVCTVVMFKGFTVIQEMKDTLARFMDKHGFKRVDEMVGRALPDLVEFGELDTLWKVRAIVNRNTCINCEKCYISCRDAGFQAIALDKKKFPIIDEKLCTGCGLCAQVCPVNDCIRMVEQ